MAGEEALLMSSLVLILAIFLRKRRSFVQRMRLMSRQMRRMRQNVVILVIQCQNNIHRRKRKTMWVYPRPQFWFEQLIVNRYQDHLWCEHFRVSRDTFEHICGLVGPDLVRQNTILRQAIPVEKPCLQAYKVLFRKNHEASVWKIILPDCLAGICHYTRCDWLRYLSGQVKPSCEVV